jgi:hypothetical protein
VTSYVTNQLYLLVIHFSKTFDIKELENVLNRLRSELNKFVSQLKLTNPSPALQPVVIEINIIKLEDPLVFRLKILIIKTIDVL